MTDGATAEVSVPRFVLGSVLRDYRQKAKMTMSQAAEAIGQTEQSVRRIEHGRVSTQIGKVTVLCELYKVPHEVQQTLANLARETKSSASLWWHSYGDVLPEWFGPYVALETLASRLRCFDPLLINGLLQADEYMQHAIRAAQPELSDDEVEARAELRRGRQRVLGRFPSPLRLEIIIAEPVLLTGLPERVMRTQLWRLLQATELPNVELRVLPLSAGLHRAIGAGAFTLIEVPGQQDTGPEERVYKEGLTGAMYLQSPAEIQTYTDVWAALAETSLSTDASVDLISARMKELANCES